MNYPRNAWYVASWAHDLPADKPFAMTIADDPVVIWRADGRLVAMADRFIHRLAPLSMGRCEGATLRCPYHGLLYDSDGRAIEIPAQPTIPASARVRTCPVAELHGWIWIWPGDPAFADEALIPAVVGPDDPDWIMGTGFLDYAAEARLINENLLDFSHLTYVHAESFGAPATFSEERPKMITLDRGIRFERWLPNQPGREGGPVLFDTFSYYEYLVPGILRMWAGNFPAGSAAANDYAQPDLSSAVGNVTFSSQAVTPTGERTSRYFFSWGPHREHDDEAFRGVFMGIMNKAFQEDKVIIEAQQRMIDRTADAKIMPTAHDAGIIIFNRIVQRMINQEDKAAIAA